MPQIYLTNQHFLVTQNSARSTKSTMPLIQGNHVSSYENVLKLLIWQLFMKPQALGMQSVSALYMCFTNWFSSSTERCMYMQ
jgi:hypothetical protein